MNTAFVQLRGLRKSYGSARTGIVEAVTGIDLDIPAGQLFGFLGPNGAGKTTTIKMICGLVKPTAGTAWVDGIDIGRRRGAAMQRVGAVLEGTRNVHWPLSAWDNLLYFGHLKGVRGHTLRARAERLLRMLELWDRRGDLVRTFSRGMQQKVAIGCALIADPPVVMLDEPTLGLDLQAVLAVRHLIKTLVEDEGKTVVLTTHQLDMAEALCDRVAIINKGRIVADQPVASLLALFREKTYRIKVEGHLTATDLASFGDGDVDTVNGDTVLRGPIDHADVLYDRIARLRSLGARLLSVEETEPSLSDVFLKLLAAGDGEGA